MNSATVATVTINSSNLLALNGSKITAQATQGQGGNILVNAEVFLHDAANVNDILNASSQVIGNDGTVAINAPNADLSSNLTVLPTRYLAMPSINSATAAGPATRTAAVVSRYRAGADCRLTRISPPPPARTAASAEPVTLVNTAPLAAGPLPRSPLLGALAITETFPFFGDFMITLRGPPCSSV